MTQKRPKRPRDTNQLAKRIVEIATGELTEDHPQPSPMAERGRNGGLKGGKARSNALSPERRQQIAHDAAEARWSKKDQR